LRISIIGGGLMKKKILWRFILISVTVLLTIVFFLPNTPVFKYMPEWWKKNMPNKGIVLGLDLQGGLHLVFEVEGDKAVEIATERYASTLKDILIKRKLIADVSKDGFTIVVSPSTPEIRKVVEENYPTLAPIETEKRLVYRISERDSQRIKDITADQALETIRNRIDQFGVSEPTIHRQGENEIVVQLPGVKDPKRAIDLIGKTAQLEFKLVDDEAKIAAELPQSISSGEEGNLLKQFAEKIPEGDEILFEKKVNRETGVTRKIPLLLKKQTALTGDLLSEARVNLDSRFNEPYVSVSFNAAGAKIFELGP
jgi:preprotein translocase subunit SecD